MIKGRSALRIDGSHDGGARQYLAPARGRIHLPRQSYQLGRWPKDVGDHHDDANME